MAYIRTELVTALERGMVVLQSFSQQALPMTLSEVARANGLTVATARREVLTLKHWGTWDETSVASSSGRGFFH
jgi:IclR family pca regulon transcriptional regulator